MILVTGATGNVGSEAARLLAARHQPTRALVRDPTRAPHGDIEIATGDFDRPDTLDAAMRGITRSCSSARPSRPRRSRSSTAPPARA